MSDRCEICNSELVDYGFPQGVDCPNCALKARLESRDRALLELKEFVHDVTLELQRYQGKDIKERAKIYDMFQRAYKLYVKYDVEGRNERQTKRTT